MKSRSLLSLSIITILALNIFAHEPLAPLSDIPDSLQLVKYQDLYSYDSDDLEELTGKLNTALILNPENVELNLLRGKILLAKKNFKAAESIMLRLNKLYPKDGAISYFLSRLYAQSNNLMSSSTYMYQIDPDYKYSETFISEMEADAYPFFTRFEKQIYDTLENKISFILRNWFIKDPSPASPENEYFQTMINRLEYAYANFYDGFALDARGYIYLKYGEPEERHEFPHRGFATECWIYKSYSKDDITFDFIKSLRQPSWTRIKFRSQIPGDSFITNKFDFNNYDESIPSSSFFEDRKMINNKYNEIFTEVNSLAIDKQLSENSPKSETQGVEDALISNFFIRESEFQSRLPEVASAAKIPQLVLSVDNCRFKGDSGSVKLETYLGLPIKQIYDAVGGNIYKKIVLNEKLAIRDNNFYPIANHSDKIEFQFEDINKAHFIDMLSFTIPPQDFALSFEVDDEQKRFIAAKTVEVNNTDFLQDKLFLSDIQLSSQITPNYIGGSRFVKNGLFIQPYPYGMFSRSTPVFIYFEIYNLLKSHSITDYTISYGLAKSYEKNILEKIFTLDLSEDPGSIQFTQNYTGNKIDDFIYFQLNTINMDIGEYVLKVRVEDKNSKMIFERDKKFFLTQ